MAELTDKQIAAEEKFMEGIPRFNIGAFFMPAIWGPAHGIWAAIIFYPLWLIADNTFYAAFEQRTALSIAIAVIVFAITVAITVAFTLIGQPIAAHRAVSRGNARRSPHDAQTHRIRASKIAFCARNLSLEKEF